MPKATGRGGAQSAKSALDAEYLTPSLGNPELIKRLKVLRRPRAAAIPSSDSACAKL